MFSFNHLAWFQPKVGGFPVPNRWPGYLVMGVFIVLVASTVRFTGDLAWIVRAGLCAAYVAISYATLSAD